MVSLKNILKLMIICVSALSINGDDYSEFDYMKMPPGLLMGAATAAYQVEGGWNVSDKSDSIWDDFTHNHPEKIQNGSTGDVACDSYHKYETDLEMLQDLGVDHYRFSIAWTRILPKGHPNYVSQSGLAHYNKLINELLAKGIKPLVTIYHWDHPQVFEDMGGWLNESMVDWFADYARVIFREFGDRVQLFATINEPYIFCTQSYRNHLFPPNSNNTGIDEYVCMHNMLKAHARAYHTYVEEFRSKQNGKIGIVVHCKCPYNKYSNDTSAADIYFDFQCGWQLNAIYSKNGDYPEIMKERIGARSKAQGYNESRLPKFSKEWIEYIKGSADYIGLNYYTSVDVSSERNTSILNWTHDDGLDYSYDPRWSVAQSRWLKINPKGMRDLLNMVKNKYNNKPVYVTENGMSTADRSNDSKRINYLYTHVANLVLAIKNDSCNVKAYTVWSLMDNFEWTDGYTYRFGLYDVNFNNDSRPRTPKRSAHWFKELLTDRTLPPQDFDK